MGQARCRACRSDHPGRTGRQRTIDEQQAIGLGFVALKFRVQPLHRMDRGLGDGLAKCVGHLVQNKMGESRRIGIHQEFHG